MFADLVLLSLVDVVARPPHNCQLILFRLDFMYAIYIARMSSYISRQRCSMSMPVCRVVMSHAPIYPRKSSRRDLIDIDRTTYTLHTFRFPPIQISSFENEQKNSSRHEEFFSSLASTFHARCQFFSEAGKWRETIVQAEDRLERKSKIKHNFHSCRVR